jgi:serine/threonine protein kinase/Tfp pilus assembly protein PilF
MQSQPGLVGQTLGRYRILEQIGEGGMGIVFRACDERLERDVAVKVLPQGAFADASLRRRFRKEALALSRLNHPNIATVHDFDSQGDVDFIVTELISGVTLDQKLASGPLQESEVAQLGAQLAEGLSAAHAEGVLHRDLKPGNVRLTLDGRLKILDFGLAKILAQPTDITVSQNLTEMGAVAGTPPYMAPEQLRGEPVDVRSDIWSAGATLYQMATGRRPFVAKTGSALAGSILHEPPPALRTLNPAISLRLQEIVLKCLDKSPEKRYQSARELLVDLRRLTADAAGSSPGQVFAAPRPRPKPRARRKRIRSLAVLPLTNLSRDPEQEYFADGMTEALICDLAKLRSLKITSRTSVMRYKRTETPLPQIAEELKVDAVVEGTVLRVGQRVRITAQLIHAATDTHLWAESYDRDPEDVLLVQSEIARAIAREIGVAVTPEEARRLGRAGRVNPEAYEAYLKGRFAWYKLSREHLDAALEYFHLALEKDPGCAFAYTGIAGVWNSRGDMGLVPPRETFPKAKEAALKAIELDDSLAEAHTSLAGVKCFEWDWPGAEKEFQRALELAPNSAEAHFFYSDLLVSLRRTSEWQVHFERAMELDPLNSFFQCFRGWYLFYLRRYDEAITELRKTLRTEPNLSAVHLRLWGALYQKRTYEEALAAAKTFFEVLGDKEIAEVLQSSYAQAGYAGAMRLAAETLAARSRLAYVSPTQVARLYAHAAEKDQALLWLEKAYQERVPAMVHLGVDMDWAFLRDDPRFQDLLGGVNL